MNDIRRFLNNSISGTRVSKIRTNTKILLATVLSSLWRPWTMFQPRLANHCKQYATSLYIKNMKPAHVLSDITINAPDSSIIFHKPSINTLSPKVFWRNRCSEATLFFRIYCIVPKNMFPFTRLSCFVLFDPRNNQVPQENVRHGIKVLKRMPKNASALRKGKI